MGNFLILAGRLRVFLFFIALDIFSTKNKHLATVVAIHVEGVRIKKAAVHGVSSGAKIVEFDGLFQEPGKRIMVFSIYAHRGFCEAGL